MITVLWLQDLTERLRTLAVDADAKQGRVARLEAQLLEALSKGGDNDGNTTVEAKLLHCWASFSCAFCKHDGGAAVGGPQQWRQQRPASRCGGENTGMLLLNHCCTLSRWSAPLVLSAA